MIGMVTLGNFGGMGGFVPAFDPECDREGADRSACSPAIIATTPLESTPPERKAPSGTSAIIRIRTDSRSRAISSSSISPWRAEPPSTKRKSQYERGSDGASPRRTRRECAGASLRTPK
jgi:hypothetical protein